MKPALLALAVLAVLVAADRPSAMVLLVFAALVGVDVAVMAWATGGRR